MSDLTRRVVLRGALGGTALVVTGCSADSLPIPIIGKDPDEDLRLVTAAAERALIDAYDSAFAAKPSLRKALVQFKAQHEQHLSVLLDGLEPPEPAPVPSIEAAGALRTLRRLESGAARQRAEACVAAQEAQWVQVLAVIGASEAGHAAALAKLSL